MTGFRLYRANFDEKDFRTGDIDFVVEDSNKNGNYISLIIGNNGTGKSRVLSNIARYFVEEFKQRPKGFFGSEFKFDQLPDKVIAVTNSISDKFPIDESFRPSETNNVFFRDFKYTYLGTRNRVNSFSNKALMNRALDIIFENYSELDISRNYRHVFDYLDYEPILKLEFKISSKLYSYASGAITPNELFSFIDNNRASDRFRRYSIDKYKEIVNNQIDELCNFINEYRERKSEILINFSEKNISRLEYDNSRYIDNVHSYNLLGILRKLDIVRDVEIKVYKKGGSEFNFRDSSSGEANILSTLIALIPLIENNSLVLIDEPEISLHPLWQSKYISLLNQIFSGFNGCHIIIASHSHFLVTDLRPKESSVITLNYNKKGILKSDPIKESTFGWSTEEILYNVFKVKTTRNYFIESDLVDLLGLISENSKETGKIRSLVESLESLHISENDPLNAVIEEANAYLKEND